MTGGHFVGSPEKGGGPIPKRRSLRNLPVDEYEDLSHMEAALSAEQRNEAARNDKHQTLRNYIKFYALQRREELERHRLRSCWVPCLTCGNCQCGRTWPSEWARCRCAAGQKQLSPYRIVWLNNSIKNDYLGTIWKVGVGPIARRAEKYQQHALGLD